MGGFKPSRSDIAGSTVVGSDKDVDSHQFTGSVDITGSLLINGVQITQNGGGGGGGSPGGSNTQIQYNDGGAFGGASSLVYDDVNNHVGIGVTDPDVILEVLDTSTQQKWSYDADSFATLTVEDDSNTTLATGENGNITLHAGPAGDIFLVADGGQVNLQNPAGTNKLAFDVENAGGLAYISNVRNNDLIFRVGTNVKEVFRLDQSEGALLMSGNFAEPGGFAPIHFRDTATSIHSPGSNRLAITAPTLEVTGTLSVEKDTDATAIVGRANVGAVPGGASDYAYFSHIDQAGVNTYALEQRANGTTSVNAPSGGQIYFRLGNVSTAMIIDGTSNNNIGINGTPSARLHVQTNSPEKDVFRCDGDEDHILFVSGSGRVGILSAAPAQTLSVSGSAAFSGTYGSTAVETVSTSLSTLTATDGVAIIDLTSAATNTSFAFFINNGTYIGQEKIVYVKTIVGADGNNSNDAALQGSNIDSPLGNANGTLSLSASDQGEGFFGMNRGAARLLWDGTDWAPISVTNLNWS